MILLAHSIASAKDTATTRVEVDWTRARVPNAKQEIEAAQNLLVPYPRL